jgi:hypothetical protein
MGTTRWLEAARTGPWTAARRPGFRIAAPRAP